jgi:hypothetical protein
MYEEIALKLQLRTEELERESLRLFLNNQLRIVESKLLDPARTYGVEALTELDSMVQEGRIHEAEAFEDYFEFDHLEVERHARLDSLKDLS